MLYLCRDEVVFLLNKQHTTSTLRASVSDSYGMFTMSKMQAHNEVKVNPESETNHKQPVSLVFSHRLI